MPAAGERGASGWVDPAKSRMLWRRPDDFGFQETMRGLGGVAAPLLAGFSLATIATLAAADRPPRLGDWAILALAGAACLLLYSMQVAFLGLGHDPRPSEALSWYPEAVVDKQTLNWLRRRQGRDYRLAVKYQARHALTYDAGLLLFLCGLGLLTWPQAGHASVARYTAVAVVGVAFAVELYWVVVRRLNPKRVARGKPRLRHPGILQMDPPDLEDPWDDGLAGVLDPERLHAAGLDLFPHLGRDGAAPGARGS
jgi:hypothetical protein